MRHPDVRASRVALIADAIVNRLVPGADAAIAALVDAGFGFLMLPPHDFELPSTSASIEYIIDDAVDYRRHEYEVIVVSVSGLPQRGVWADAIAAELERRGEPPFREVDLAVVDGRSLTASASPPCGGLGRTNQGSMIANPDVNTSR